MAAIIRLRRNGWLKWIGFTCAIVGIVGFGIALSHRHWLMLAWIPLWLGGVILGAIGADYGIGESFLKIGFTRVRWDQITRAVLSGTSEIRIVTAGGKEYVIEGQALLPESRELLLSELHRRAIPVMAPEPRVSEEW